jgi:hypothetical protein
MWPGLSRNSIPDPENHSILKRPKRSFLISVLPHEKFLFILEWAKSDFLISTMETQQQDFSIGCEGMVAWCPKAVDAGFITQTQFEQWKAEIQQQKSIGTKFFSAKMMTVIARKVGRGSLEYQIV